jgi:hypothetical protein
MLVEKSIIRSTKMKSAKPKGKSKEGPSTKTNIPTANTRKVSTCTQAWRSITVPKRPRRTTTVPWEDIQKGAKKGDTYQDGEEGAHEMTSGEHPSQAKITTMYMEEIHKMMKYTKEDPIITLIEDDVDFKEENVQDRGEEVVNIVEEHR